MEHSETYRNRFSQFTAAKQSCSQGRLSWWLRNRKKSIFLQNSILPRSASWIMKLTSNLSLTWSVESRHLQSLLALVLVQYKATLAHCTRRSRDKKLSEEVLRKTPLTIEAKCNRARKSSHRHFCLRFVCKKLLPLLMLEIFTSPVIARFAFCLPFSAGDVASSTAVLAIMTMGGKISFSRWTA